MVGGDAMTVWPFGKRRQEIASRAEATREEIKRATNETSVKVDRLTEVLAQFTEKKRGQNDR